jgi:hypothetical protein
LLLLGACAACGTDSNDVKGPFTGPSHRFWVDRIDVPRDNAQALAVAADLDGDDAVENQFGNVTGVLAGTTDLASVSDSADMIASRYVSSYVEIQADDLLNDDSVGITYVVQPDDQTHFVFGGKLVDGAFISNRTRDTRAPGSATVDLPVFTNADPLRLLLEAGELELTSDGDGYTAVMRGGFREELARDAAFNGLIQMFQDEPQRHLVFSRGVDTNHDGVVSRDEVDNSVINLLVTADVDLFDGSRLAPHPNSQSNDCISVAFQFHLSPTEPMGTPQDMCRDRSRDGDETSSDCGGSCQKCWDGHACMVDADCQSNSCVLSNGSLEGPPYICATATCSDGVRDAFESDADCGGPCAGCAAGKVCAGDTDCASNNCDNSLTNLGHCQ